MNITCQIIGYLISPINLSNKTLLILRIFNTICINNLYITVDFVLYVK
ncbi:hypothetical protein VCRA2119O240_510011 [Vibrio crassostreae]|nr:hypothetical protein VCRA2118O236_490004 [Vibrio crassostreae]CAK2117732.1 hypothetical protein VCRA2110O177_420015 [Vibrio crassostreae]CAK2119587.1 hypothetical protein VCRA2110O180_440015 [Vibrio crassostreae]CAK2120193.1 hypothetical protein VCRA2110O181_420005 [Vibrio crassostreae]CAK2122757.1 hypothetical protein VCRA2113O198_450004 [Vibrio crassostreae]